MECEATQVDDDKNEETCPLFMEGLPQNFSSNPHLAALSSLIDEEEDDAKQEATDENLPTKRNKNPAPSNSAKQVPGGGKVRHAKKSQKRKSKPYMKGKETPRKNKASMGEAQLFMKMWKL